MRQRLPLPLSFQCRFVAAHCACPKHWPHITYVTSTSAEQLRLEPDGWFGAAIVVQPERFPEGIGGISCLRSYGGITKVFARDLRHIYIYRFGQRSEVSFMACGRSRLVG